MMARRQHFTRTHQRNAYGIEARCLREEQTAIVHPVALRIRRSKLEKKCGDGNAIDLLERREGRQNPGKRRIPQNLPGVRLAKPQASSRHVLNSCHVRGIHQTSPMNPYFPALLLFGSGLLAAGETSPAAALPMESNSPAIPRRTTYIPGNLTVKPFTPPPPRVPKPLPACRIDASVTHRTKDGTTLTLQLGEPSTAPDLPEPPPPAPRVAPRDPTPEEIARRIYHLRHSFNLGATIYDHRVSVVNWTDLETRVSYQAVCGYDIGLLAGTGGFVHEGENYRFMLFHTHLRTEWLRRVFNRWQPNLPEVAEGEIIITKGDPANAIGTAPVVLIGKVIAGEENRLAAFQTARQAYFKDAAAWAAAHPPVPKNETFIFRPHRGSRYLKKEGGAK